MKFVKMEGCGNDYIYVNGATEIVQNKPEVVRALSDRHFGIGGDGVIFINPSKTCDFEMEMYNADGTRSEMCGNGMRCVAKFVYDYGLTNKTELVIESAGKKKFITLFLKDGKVDKVKVNMGAPILDATEIPVIADTKNVINSSIIIDKLANKFGDSCDSCDSCGAEYKMTCVSMGNPHAVVFMENVDNLEIEKIGPFFENHERFPRRTNTEFVKILDRKNVQMRVWERGTGETLACGTGCCATAVACVLNNLTERKITVHLLGGELEIEWNEADNNVYMTGPARIVFEGTVNI